MLTDLQSVMASMLVSADKSYGHIYAVEYDDGVVKIGRTTSPEKRMYTLTRFRGEYHRITRCYISETVLHASSAERLAMSGLVPCFGSECFDIPFACAVSRVKAVTDGAGAYFEGASARDVRERFPSTERPQDGLERVFKNLVELMSGGIYAEHQTD